MFGQKIFPQNHRRPQKNQKNQKNDLILIFCKFFTRYD